MKKLNLLYILAAIILILFLVALTSIPISAKEKDDDFWVDAETFDLKAFAKAYDATLKFNKKAKRYDFILDDYTVSVTAARPLSVVRITDASGNYIETYKTVENPDSVVPKIFIKGHKKAPISYEEFGLFKIAVYRINSQYPYCPLSELNYEHTEYHPDGTSIFHEDHFYNAR